MHESGTSSLLCYVDDSLPGITRRALKRGWAYCDAKGRRIADYVYDHAFTPVQD